MYLCKIRNYEYERKINNLKIFINLESLYTSKLGEIKFFNNY